MALEYTVKTLDGLSEDVAKMYTETDGAFTLDVSGLDIPDVSGLKSALDKERDRANSEHKARKAAEKAAQEKEDAAARAAGDIETIEKNLREKYTGEIEERDAKISARDAKLSKVLHRDEAYRIANAQAVDSDAAEVVAEWIQNRTEIQEKDGDFVVLPKGDSMGLTMEEFVKKIPEQKALGRLIKSSNGTGGGATRTSGTGSANETKGDLGGNKAERVAAIKARIGADN